MKETLIDHIGPWFWPFLSDSTSLPAVLAVFLVGYLFFSPRYFYHILTLSLLGILVNVFLKGSFKVPLYPHLGPGFAFPSGHMQFGCLFYGSIAFYYRHWALRVLIACLLCGLGYSLVAQHYHDGLDVLGAVFVALCLRLLYTRFAPDPHGSFKQELRLFARPLILFALLLLAGIWAVQTMIPIHAWIAFFGLILLWALQTVLEFLYPSFIQRQ